MWDCPDCGCLRIAASLTFCPMCFRERNMPKATVEGGASNAWADYEASSETAQDAEVVQPEPEPVAVQPEPVVVQPPVPVRNRKKAE